MLRAMQKHIYVGIVAMHAVYANGGLAAVEEIVDVGGLGANTRTAWFRSPGANLRFSRWEQKLAIAVQGDRVRDHGRIHLLRTAVSRANPSDGRASQYRAAHILVGIAPKQAEAT